MDKATEEKIKARIATLEKERDVFVQQANQQIAGYSAAIAELQKLLAPETAPEQPVG